MRADDNFYTGKTSLYWIGAKVVDSKSAQINISEKFNVKWMQILYMILTRSEGANCNYHLVLKITSEIHYK